MVALEFQRNRRIYELIVEISIERIRYAMNYLPRIISRLDIKNEFVIKGIQLEGLRRVGEPLELCTKYYKQGVDEIMFMDAVASLYDRNSLFSLIELAASCSFIPIALGGGLRSIDDVIRAFDSGADKVIINTAAVRDISIVSKVANRYGSQAMIASIQAKRTTEDHWEAYIDNGRQPTGLDVLTWAKQLVSEGAGEVAVTSVDREGTKKGFDVKLSKLLTENLMVPVTISGGCGKMDHVNQLIELSDPSGVAIASCFHYNMFTPAQLKEYLA